MKKYSYIVNGTLIFVLILQLDQGRLLLFLLFLLLFLLLFIIFLNFKSYLIKIFNLYLPYSCKLNLSH